MPDEYLDLNCTIDAVVLRTENIDLDFRILNRNVFSKIKELEIMGDLKSLDQRIFKEFKFIKKVTLKMTDLRYFLHRFGTRWINYLYKSNSSQNIDRDIIKVEFDSINLIEYEYPNEDFCLFADIPYQSGVFLHIYFDYLTCTNLWIISQSSLLNVTYNPYSYLIAQDFFD